MMRLEASQGIVSSLMAVPCLKQVFIRLECATCE